MSCAGAAGVVCLSYGFFFQIMDFFSNYGFFSRYKWRRSMHERSAIQIKELGDTVRIIWEPKEARARCEEAYDRVSYTSLLARQ
jgi:hypothetical protein